ncbi:MAG: hypothetical protein H0T89_03665 [Deltaproteobacteria bacterium]|nr:hypothetical protein [Deltaproteobacteria bacterium]MDQ3300271.1 hypothetical protein [Myxococcota bacterium]
MNTRLVFTLTSLAFGLAAAACGGGGSSTPPDAPMKDIGFNKPTGSLKANNEVSADNWVEIGPADLSCIGTPAADPATTVGVTLSAVVRDFQSDNLVPNTNVVVFKDQDQSMVFDTKQADGNAAVTLTLPVGTKRFGYKMTSDSALDTLLLNQKVEPDMEMQNAGVIKSVSKTTAQTLPALIGVSRTVGTGVLAGAFRDCQDNEISNFIATVSTTSGTVNHAAGADTYYFSPTVGLPVRHSQQAAGSKNGLFMIIELQPATSAYVQVWGYKTDADVAADNLELVAELQTAVVAETVITGAYEPLRTQ